MDELGNLLDRTGKREEKISEISSKLEIELGDLSSFLENLASRRPKGELGFSFTTFAGSYRKVPRFSDARKISCNLPKIQTKS